MKSVAKDLTKEIAEKSIYDYLENTLGVSIVTSKRIMTVEKMTEIDEKYLDLAPHHTAGYSRKQTYGDCPKGHRSVPYIGSGIPPW